MCSQSILRLHLCHSSQRFWTSCVTERKNMEICLPLGFCYRQISLMLGKMGAGRHCREGPWESRGNEGEVWGCDPHLATESECRVVWSTGWRSTHIAWGKDCWTLLWHPFSLFSLFVIEKKKKSPPEFQVVTWLSSPDLAVALLLLKRIVYKRGKERGMKY